MWHVACFGPDSVSGGGMCLQCFAVLRFLVEVVTFPVPGSLFMLIRLTAGGSGSGRAICAQTVVWKGASGNNTSGPADKITWPSPLSDWPGKSAGGGSAISASVCCGKPNPVLPWEMTDNSNYGNYGQLDGMEHEWSMDFYVGKRFFLEVTSHLWRWIWRTHHQSLVCYCVQGVFKCIWLYCISETLKISLAVLVCMLESESFKMMKELLKIRLFFFWSLKFYCKCVLIICLFNHLKIHF